MDEIEKELANLKINEVDEVNEIEIELNKLKIDEVNPVEKKLFKIIAETFNIDESKIIMEANFVDDLGADSLSLVELMMAIEAAFGCDIPDQEASKMTTIAQVVQYIKDKQISA